MNAQRKVKQGLTNLILDQPFFGTLALRLKVSPSTETDTAATDGKVLLYNPDFIDSLEIAQVTSLIAHEVLHAANGHPWRRSGRDQSAWNKACDLAINGILEEAGFYLPPDGLLDPAFNGQSAEAIYDQIRQDKQDGQGDDQGSGWGDVKDNLEPDTRAQEAEWQVATLQAAQMAKAQGKLPAGLARLIETIKKPAIDWRSALRRFIQESAKADYTWKKPNTRYLSSGLYLPSLKSEQMRRIALAVDTSGSVSPTDLEQFGSEIQAIVDECQPEGLTVIYCDAYVQGVEEYEPMDMVELKALGGGGTDFRPVFDYMEEHAIDIDMACLVYLTDMYGVFPSQAPDYPVLWASTSSIDKAPFGEVLSFPRG